MSRPASGFAAVAALVAALGSACAPAGDATHANNDFTDRLRVYYVGYPVGYETLSLTPSDAGYIFAADLDYGDRGRRSHTISTLRTGPDFAATMLEVARINADAEGGVDSVTLEARVEVDGGSATVEVSGEPSTVALSGPAFAIRGINPVSQHLPLLRYWLANGEPERIGVVPGMPVNDVHIARRGRDTLSVNGRAVVLDRFAVEGVVWGTAAVWLDAELRLAAFASGGGGGLTFEAVRVDLDPVFPELQAIATRDRLEDLAAMTGAVERAADGTSSNTVALVGAMVVDGTGRPPVPNATILVRDGRIVAVGRDLAVPQDAQTVDVSGKTIVPGLWDMHTHTMQVEWAPVYLAAGVTTVRDMGNTLPFIVPFRDALRAGRGLGPRLLLAGLIDGGGAEAFGAVNATTPEEGRAEVRRYHDLGFEQMKLYSLLRPEVVAAINDEAHGLGMTVSGHVPRALTLLQAIEAGMDHIAHLPIRGDVRSDSIQALIQAVAATGAVLDPTLSWGEVLRRSRDEPMSVFQPGVDFLPPVLAQHVLAWGADVDVQTARSRMEATLAVVKALHDAGVPMVVGTDEGVPGFSVYRDIELYVQAGLTPMEALRAATAVPAQAMGVSAEVGTLEVGRRADVLVLDADPLEDISNIRTGRWVMIGGAMYRTADLWRAVGFTAPGE